MTKWNLSQDCFHIQKPTYIIFMYLRQSKIIVVDEEVSDKSIHQVIWVLSNLGREVNFLSLIKGTYHKQTKTIHG